MAETAYTISQIQIGNLLYNLKDTAVREKLKNVQDNTTALWQLYSGYWHLKETLLTNDQWKTTNKNYPNRINYWLSADGVIRYYINSTTGKLYGNFVERNNPSIEGASTIWHFDQTKPNPLPGMPTIVNQCAIIMQYRFKTYFYKQGSLTAQVLRRTIQNSTALNIAANYNGKEFSVMNATPATFTHILSKGGVLNGSVLWIDRITKKSSAEMPINGYEYKLGINNYYKTNDADKSSIVQGIGARALLIAQGNTEEKLYPTEQDPEGTEEIDVNLIDDDPDGGTNNT